MFSKKHESGQALILVAFMTIGLIAMVGLAIDGGGLYFLQRDAQNAVDAAMIAATYAQCAGGDYDSVVFAAREAARKNGFIHGQNANIEIRQLGGTNRHQVRYNEVRITASKDIYFARVVTRRDQEFVTVYATGACLEAEIVVENALLFAMSTVCQDALALHGGNIYIEGSTASNNGTNISTSSGVINGMVLSSGDDPIQLSTGVILNPSTNNPSYIQEVLTMEGLFGGIEAFAPGGQHAVAANNLGQYEYHSGNYSINTNSSSTPVLLQNKLIFVEGNFSIIGSNYLWENVTVVTRGGISMSADSINLSPYINDPNDGSLLLYSNKVSNCGNTAVSLSSSSASWYGAIYVPQGNVRMSNADNSGFGRIIAQAINISGSNIQFIDTRGVEPLLPPKIWIAA